MKKQKKRFYLSLILIIIASIFIVILYINKSHFYATQSIYNNEARSIFVNDKVILLVNNGEASVISKETKKKMKLGLGTPVVVNYKGCFPYFMYFLEKDSIIKTDTCGASYSQKKYNLSNYNESTLSGSSKFFSFEEGVNYYDLTPSLLFGHSNISLLLNDYYSVRGSQLYQKNKVISQDSLLNNMFSIDKDEIFYVTTNFYLMHYENGKSKIIVQDDVLSTSITKRYIYYFSKSLDTTVRIDRNDYSIKNSMAIEDAYKIRDYEDYTFYVDNESFFTLKDNTLIYSIDNVLDFDIDESDVYIYHLDQSVSKTSFDGLKTEILNNENKEAIDEFSFGRD